MSTLKRIAESQPVYSCCSLGSRGWFWVVYSSTRQWCDGSLPVASGHEASKENCIQAALAVAPDARQDYAYVASQFHRRLCVQKRAKKQSNGNGTATLEFCYDGFLYISDGPEPSVYRFIPHRIVKKTKKRIFIDRRPFREGREPWLNHDGIIDVETYALDRAELEKNGSVYHGPWNRFYTEQGKAELLRTQRTSPELDALGLSATSVEEIKRAYRQRVKECHPDCGGDAAEFIRLQKAYSKAMAAVGEAI